MATNPLHPPSLLKNLHWKILGVGLVVGFACFLYFIDPTEVGFTVCMVHRFTDWPCPGCGMWRASHRLLHGDFAGAWAYHPAWPAYSLLLLVGLGSWGFGLSRHPKLQNPALWFCLAWIGIAWGWRILQLSR